MGISYRSSKPTPITPIPETPVPEIKEKKKVKRTLLIPPSYKERQILNKTSGLIQKTSEQLIMPKALIAPEMQKDVILTTKFENRKNHKREIEMVNR
jgi:hypothetical protein